MTKNEERRKILEVLCKFDDDKPRHPVFTHKIAERASLDSKTINSALYYLRDKNYVEITSETSHSGDDILLVRITAFGRDIVEDEEKLEKEFPLVSVTIDQSSKRTQNIGVAYGSAISQEGDAALTQRTSIQALSTSVYQRIDQQLKDDQELNTRLKNEVKEVEDAISDGNVTVGGIKDKLWCIAKKASWLKEILFPIIIEAIKRKLFGGST
ncbi:MAG: hypothetical protein WCE90_04105 [Candidatus Zixiibacteriota bacterium]